MKKNKSWSALLISIFVTMIIIVIALYLLEKIIPFSGDIKGIENGNISYYRANTGLNEALLTMSGSDPSIAWSNGSLINGSGRVYTITANGMTMPQLGQWNSEYDNNWAILGPGRPMQLVLSNGIDWSTTNFSFRVPDLNRDNSWSDQILSGTGPIIQWTLSASWEVLQASGSQIMANDILLGSPISLESKNGLTISGSGYTFKYFYDTNCAAPKKCTLKLSLVNRLLLNDGVTTTPYLEFQAHFSSPIPLQTAVIETQWYAGGFRKNITRYIQQLTTSEALDFTVFQ